MPRFTFDVKLFGTFNVEADTQENAERKLRDVIDGAEANFGAFINGDPVLAIVSLDDGGFDLIEDSNEEDQ